MNMKSCCAQQQWTPLKQKHFTSAAKVYIYIHNEKHQCENWMWMSTSTSWTSNMATSCRDNDINVMSDVSSVVARQCCQHKRMHQQLQHEELNHMPLVDIYYRPTSRRPEFNVFTGFLAFVTGSNKHVSNGIMSWITVFISGKWTTICIQAVAATLRRYYKCVCSQASTWPGVSIDYHLCIALTACHAKLERARRFRKSNWTRSLVTTNPVLAEVSALVKRHATTVSMVNQRWCSDDLSLSSLLRYL